MTDWDDWGALIDLIANEEDPPTEEEWPVIERALESTVFGPGAGPVLEGIHRYAKAKMVGPWAVLGSCLARVVAEVPPWVRIPAFVGSEASLNLYVALVDSSGAGKSASWSASAAALDLGSLHAEEVPIGTGEGLLDSFMRKATKEERDAGQPNLVMRDTPQMLVYVDEIGQLQMGGARSGATIDPVLRMLWSGVRAGTHNADPDRKRNLPPHSYRLGLVAGVQPELASSLLSQQAHSSGTAQRWLWLPVIDPDMTADPLTAPPPMRWARPTTVGGDYYVTHITYPAHVEQEVRDQRAIVGSGRGTRDDAVKAHRMLTRLKVAAAVALLHGALEVDETTWTISEAIMARSDRTRAGVLATLDRLERDRQAARGRAAYATDQGRAEAETEDVERVAARLWTLVAEKHKDDHDGKGCTRACVSRFIAARDRLHKSAAIEYALDVGLLTEDRDNYEGTHYFPGPRMPNR